MCFFWMFAQKYNMMTLFAFQQLYTVGLSYNINDFELPMKFVGC